MSTSTLVMDFNDNGTDYTVALNAALAAINTCHSGSSEPTNEVNTGKMWLDTGSNNELNFRIGASWKPTFIFGTTTSLILDGTITGADLNTTSDRRLKENIVPVKFASSILENLDGVYFNYIGQEEKHVGFIAQDVEQFLPEVVKTAGNDIKSISYGNITAILVEGFKEQQSVIREQDTRIQELEAKLELVMGRIQELESKC